MWVVVILLIIQNLLWTVVLLSSNKLYDHVNTAIHNILNEVATDAYYFFKKNKKIYIYIRRNLKLDKTLT